MKSICLALRGAGAKLLVMRMFLTTLTPGMGRGLLKGETSMEGLLICVKARLNGDGNSSS